MHRDLLLTTPLRVNGVPLNERVGPYQVNLIDLQVCPAVKVRIEDGDKIVAGRSESRVHENSILSIVSQHDYCER